MLECSGIDGTLSAPSEIWIEKICRFHLPSCFGAGAAGQLLWTRRSGKEILLRLLSDKIESAFVHPIAFNLIPHIDQFREDGYAKRN